MKTAMTETMLIQSAASTLTQMADRASRVIFGQVVTRWSGDRFEIGTIDGSNVASLDRTAESLINEWMISSF